MKLNRKLVLILALVLSLAMATTGTLAYLTDRDSEANVFTMGNVEIDLTEDFEQGAELLPGLDIEKKPVITNTGKTEAWAWLTFSVPAALDNPVQGTEQGSNENVIHWNPMGATTEGYVTDARVQKAFTDGLLTADMFPAGTTNYVDYINANNMTWNVFNSLGEGKNMFTETINGVAYNTYVLLYNKALQPGETTLPNIYKVFLDAYVDIDPDGNLSKVNAGVVTPIEWNINEDGNPIIYASAYAIQKEGFATVEEAYAAYNAQWGDNGAEYGDPAVLIYTYEELVAFFAQGGTAKLMNDIEAEAMLTIQAGVNAVLDMNGKTLTAKDSTVDPMIAMESNTSFVIDGNGTFDLGDATGANLIWPKKNKNATITIKNGNFLRTPGDDLTKYGFPFIVGETTCKVIIEGGYFDGGYYKEGDCEGICESNLNLSTNQDVKIYGGTFVGQNPAWGDEGKGAYCPHCDIAGSGCQGTFLEGQKTTDTELPAAYKITEGMTEDGRPTYTVNYGK